MTSERLEQKISEIIAEVIVRYPPTDRWVFSGRNPYDYLVRKLEPLASISDIVINDRILLRGKFSFLNGSVELAYRIEKYYPSVNFITHSMDDYREIISGLPHVIQCISEAGKYLEINYQNIF